MFKFEEICELIRLVGASDVASVEIEHAGSRIRVEGRGHLAVGPTAPVLPGGTGGVAHPAVQPPPPVAAAAAAAGRGEPPAEDDSLHYVTSPIVGTFYRAPGPEAEPYAKTGDSVEKGQVLCIVEAMKLMNEIESDISGTVVKVLVENATPVEYGERLFAIRID